MQWSWTPLLVLALPAAAQEDTKTGADKKPPRAKLTVSKETTYATEPVDAKTGWVDFETAINRRLSQKVTPANNSAALLWKAFGPTPEGAELPAEFFKWMGIDAPPRRGSYYVDVIKAIRDLGRPVGQDEINDIFDRQGRASSRPWTSSTHPDLAAWLKTNEKPLAVVLEATRRTHYFHPLVSRKGKDGDAGSLLGVLLPGVQKCREFASALTARAMLHLGEGRLDEAWQDLLACHRLARLIGRGGTLIESLVGVAIEAIACNSTLAYLADPRVTPKQLRACLRDIQALPARSVMADKIDLAERFMYLDAVRLVSRGGLELMEALAGGPPVKALDAKTKAALAKIDWDPALRAGNRWFDRMAESMRHKTRAEREKALDELDDDIKALKAGAAAPENLLKVLQAGGEPDKETGKAIGDVLIVMLVPAVRKVQSADDRAEQINRNLQVAIALALYQREHKAYPQTLKALAPKYLAAIPDDIFSGKAMNYRPAEKGYLLYSVGANGKDEEGRWYDDQPSGDDPRVRMPLPELPRK